MTVGRMTLRPIGSAALWDDLARSQPGGSAFHAWDFLDLQERMLGVVIERLLVEVDEVPAGVVPLARRAGHGTGARRAPWLPFPLLGPAVPASMLPAVLRAVRTRQWRSGLVLSRFDVAPALAEAASAAVGPARMRLRSDGTVQVDLSHGSVERLDAAMGRTRRKRIRQALRAGVRARAAEPGELAGLLGVVLQAAYSGRGAASPYPDDIGEVLESWSERRDDVRLSLVEADERPVGALVTLLGHPQAAGWIGAVMPEAQGVAAESVLLREAMIDAMLRGRAAWEFGGRVDDDVERYKLSFGGAAVPYATIESFLGPIAIRDLLGRL